MASIRQRNGRRAIWKGFCYALLMFSTYIIAIGLADRISN